MKVRSMWFIKCSWLVVASVLAAACVTAEREDVDERSVPAVDGEGGGGGGVGEVGDCAAILEQNCDPADKPQTPDEVTACEEQRQDSYDQCVAGVACQAAYATQVEACGDKPAEGTPAYDDFLSCVGAAGAALEACIGEGGSGGGGGGSGGGGD